MSSGYGANQRDLSHGSQGSRQTNIASRAYPTIESGINSEYAFGSSKPRHTPKEPSASRWARMHGGHQHDARNRANPDYTHQYNSSHPDIGPMDPRSPPWGPKSVSWPRVERPITSDFELTDTPGPNSCNVLGMSVQVFRPHKTRCNVFLQEMYKKTRNRTLVAPISHQLFLLLR